MTGIFDLRVDDAEKPIEELQRLLEIHKKTGAAIVLKRVLGFSSFNPTYKKGNSFRLVCINHLTQVEGV